jgi:murein DD-endopeptidase MepM/ murein hydrolase activator NlpD
MIRGLVVLLLAAAVVLGGLYVIAGRGTPPEIVIERPERAIGQEGTLEVTLGSPGGQLGELTITLEQGGRSIPLFSLATPQDATITQPDEDHLHISRPLGKRGVPELQTGPARIVVTASRDTFLDLRTLSSTATKEVQVRLEPPRLAVLSTFHYVNHGGAELVVYRVTPPDVVSGVRVGNVEYPGYDAAGAGVAGAGPETKVAFFALLHDQDLNTPMALFARDEAGNEATSAFVDRAFPKQFRRSRIELDDRFIQRVVPEILQRSPELKASAGSADEMLPAFLSINGELRRQNAARIAEISAATSPTRLWQGEFVQLGNSQVEAGFADHRTYLFAGEEVDQQVHLGFDLAVTSAIPVVAANAGKVLFADWLGIYGNCVIVDHGLGVGSLYAHLSAIDVSVGDAVTKGQALGRSGMTGLAAGDHLHFTMLLQGRPVNPVEWWDRGWIEDRVERKLKAAAGAAP